MSCSTHWRSAIGCADRTPRLSGPRRVTPASLIERIARASEPSMSMPRHALGHDADLETCLAAVDRRIEDAEIGGEPAQGDALESALFQVTREPGRRPTVVFAKRRVGVDRAS